MSINNRPQTSFNLYGFDLFVDDEVISIREINV